MILFYKNKKNINIYVHALLIDNFYYAINHTLLTPWNRNPLKL